MGFWSSVRKAISKIAGDPDAAPSSVTPPTIKLDIPIAMVGARGVGKTSMLTAIWNEFETVFPDPDLQCIPDDRSRRILVRKKQELEKLASGPVGPCPPEAGIQGTADIAIYKLTLHHTPTQAELTITFTDYPGAWLTDVDGPVERQQKVLQAIQDARILLLPIDSPALMELPAYEDIRNDPDSIGYALRDTLKSSPHQDSLVIFSPIRAEKWLQHSDQLPLLQRFEERFRITRGTIGAYAKNDGNVGKVTAKRVASVLCPIQTLGSVHFDRFENGTPLFLRVNAGGYAPVGCDQPLRLALMFMLRDLQVYAEAKEAAAKEKLDKRGTYEKTMGGIRNFLGFPTSKQKEFDHWVSHSASLLESLAKYADSCKPGAGFYLLSGGDLLGMEEVGRWSNTTRRS